MPNLPTGPVLPAIYAGQIYEVTRMVDTFLPTLFPPQESPHKFKPQSLQLGDRFIIIKSEEFTSEFQVNPLYSGIPLRQFTRYAVSVWGLVGFPL
jgi:hypothetical protein